MQFTIDWLNLNSGWLALLLALVPIVWSVLQYLSVKQSEIKQREFENYHALIKLLVEREDPDVPIKLDRQVAIAYELRNYKGYYEVSKRILAGLKDDWKDYGPELKRARLLEELDATLKHMK